MQRDCRLKNHVYRLGMNRMITIKPFSHCSHHFIRHFFGMSWIWKATGVSWATAQLTPKPSDPSNPRTLSLFWKSRDTFIMTLQWRVIINVWRVIIKRGGPPRCDPEFNRSQNIH